MDSFQRIELVAGKTGLHKQITWPFICTTNTVSEWLNGGELIFITGSGINTDTASLVSLLEESIQYHLSGMVILISDEYIREVSPHLIWIANKNNFPLFAMPWEIKLIDVTQEISRHILINRSEQEKERQFLSNLIFSDDKGQTIEELMHIYMFPTKRVLFLFTLEFVDGFDKKTKLQAIQNDTVASLKNRCHSSHSYVIPMPYSNMVVGLGLTESKENVKNLQQKMISVLNLLELRYKGATITLTFGKICTSMEDIRTTYQQLKQISNSNIRTAGSSITNYYDLGLIRLLLEIPNKNALKEYVLEYLGDLIQRDSETESELCKTLYSFLLNNGNLVQTAKSLFIHRNTLIYRITLIESLLDTDLNDGFLRNELFNCFQIAKYLQMIPV